MRNTFTFPMVALASVALAGEAGAAAHTPAMDHYRAISERNAFGLKPREQPVANVAPPPPLRKVILTGITTLSQKRALLKLEPLPGHHDQKEESLILAEGQRDGDLEVLRIDEHARVVTVNNAGTVMKVTFEKETPKPGGGPVVRAFPVRTAAFHAPPFPASRGLPRRWVRWPVRHTAAPAVR
jgi:hypothetical protein